MTQSFRLDTLNLHFSNWNQRKVRYMPQFLHRRLQKAQEQFNIHTIQLEELKEELGLQRTERWHFMEQTEGQRVYQLLTDKAPSRDRILLDLTRRQAGQDRPLRMEDSALAIWINDGIEIENDQQALRLQAKEVNAGSMDRDHVLLERRRNSLWLRIMEWCSNAIDDNPAYLAEEMDRPDRPEDDSIILPSLSKRQGWSDEASNIELRLREGQANDALKAIRTLLSQQLFLIREKERHVRGIVGNTRANNIINRINKEIRQSAEQYHRTYKAMLALGMPDKNQAYQDLDESHLTWSKALNKNRPLGVGYEGPVSWIWHMREGGGPAQLDDNWLEEVCRVQYLDMKANTDRWHEEVELLSAELRRVVLWFEDASRQWESRSDQAHIDANDGLAAYAARMSNIYMRLQQKASTYVA